MNNSKYMVIDLATQQPTIKPIGDYLFARQGDNRRPLPIWFQQSGQPFALDGYTVEWAQTNADGTPLVVSGTTISGSAVGQIVFYFPANAFAVAGTVTGHFLITKDSDGTVISTIDLNFDVTKDNVLMNLDTTPFMNDWEQFKASIQSQTDALKDRADGFDSTIKSAQAQASSIETLVNNNQVAKTSDLNNYVAKSGDSTIAGTLSANEVKTINGASLNDILTGLKRVNGYNTVTDEPLASGLYKYDLSTWVTQSKPPFLTDDMQVGNIRASVFDSKNMIFEWLPSGWVQRVIDGNWDNWTNHQGIVVYNGTATSTSQISLLGSLNAFTHCWVEVTYASNHYFGWFDTSDFRLLAMGSKGQQTSFSIVGSASADKKSLQMSQFKSQTNGVDTIETGTATLKIKGFKY